MQEARAQLALLRFARLIVSQLGSISSLRLIPTIHSFSSLRVQRNTHGALANPDLSQAMAPSKQKRTHAVFRVSSAHRLASTSKPRFVGEKVPFADVFTEVSRGTKKFKQSEYAEIGAHPIVDQGKEAIAGYSGEENGLFTDVPAIVFGDHTRCVKYVEEPFFAGADGVKILKPKLPGSTRFWWHALRATPIEDLGYSRHFKLLKAATFKVVNEARQEEVVACLDGVLEQISYAEDQLTGFDSLVKSRFVETFGYEPSKSSYEVCSVEDVANVSVGVVIKPKQYYSDNPEDAVKAFRSLNVGDMHVQDADWVYFTEAGNAKTSKTILHSGDVLIVRSGYPGTSCVVPDEYDGCNAIDLIIARPDRNKIIPEYLAAFNNGAHMKSLIAKSSVGSAQKHFNVGFYKKVLLPLPPISVQKEYVDFFHQVDKSRFVRDHEMNFRCERFTLSWSTIA